MNHIYRISDGSLVSSTADPVVTVPSGMAVVVSDKTGVWNPITLDFDPRPNSPFISTGAFFDRFTQDELEALIIAARTNAKPAVFLKRLDLKESVDLLDANLQADMVSMKNAGIVTTARAQAILTP